MVVEYHRLGLLSLEDRPQVRVALPDPLQVVADARLLRKARAVLGALTAAEWTRAEEEIRSLAALEWSGLDPGERALAVPVVAIAPEDEDGGNALGIAARGALGGSTGALSDELGSLLDLMAGDLPVIVVALTGGRTPSSLGTLVEALGSDRTTPRPVGEAVEGPQAPRIPFPGARLAQASVAHGGALDAAVTAALLGPLDPDGPDRPDAATGAPAPALGRILAPEPGEGRPADRILEHARSLVDSGAFRLFAGRSRGTGDGAAPLGQEAGDASAGEAEVERLRAELAAVRAEAEARVAEAEQRGRQSARLEVAGEVRSRLLDLALRTLRNTGPGGGADPGPGEAGTPLPDSGRVPRANPAALGGTAGPAPGAASGDDDGPVSEGSSPAVNGTPRGADGQGGRP